jgi:hypothetical protein
LNNFLTPSDPDAEHKYWVEVFKREKLSPENTTKERIMVCYRLTRALADLKGICSPGQSLVEGTNMTPSPWNSEITCFKETAQDASKIKLLRAQTLALPLLPPMVSPTCTKRNHRKLAQWLGIMTRLANRLHINSSEEGRRGLWRLLDPDYVHELWIRPEIMMAFENAFLSRLLEMQVNDGIVEAQTAAIKQFHLSQMECKKLCDLARAAAPDIVADNLETKKAFMELRIDQFMKRARNESDLRAELQGLKLLAAIQGLHKVEPEDDIKTMVDVVKEVSSREDNDEDEDDEIE